MNLRETIFESFHKEVDNISNNNSIEYLNFIRKGFESISGIDYELFINNLPSTIKSTTKSAIKDLKIAYREGNLNLVLGAGISSIYGLPTWDNLLQRLLLRTIKLEAEKAAVLSKFFTKIFNPSPLIAGRYLQESLVDKDRKHIFEQVVRDALYETFYKKANSQIMDEIIKLCIAPGSSPNLDGIITYNYDDIIESKLLEKEIGIPFQSLYGQGINPDNKSLAIYHVHGYLPQIGPINDHNAITFGEFVYHEQYNNIYSWNNIVQINKFRDKICLFIGTSLSDPNIRRLLDIANSQKSNKKFHYILKQRLKKAWVEERLNKLLDDNPEIFDEKVKANLDFDDTINFLIEMKNRFEEKDSESLGVKTVWIDDFENDISDFLRKVRE